MVTTLERRLAEVILGGADTFTADDLTYSGQLAADPSHAANARQNSIGTLFNKASRSGRIAFTGDIKRSSAPHRKGGAIRVWRATEAGRLWARSILGGTP